jgi:hypothetical protein
MAGKALGIDWAVQSRGFDYPEQCCSRYSQEPAERDNRKTALSVCRSPLVGQLVGGGAADPEYGGGLLHSQQLRELVK